MMTLKLDDDTAKLLKELVEKEHLGPEQLVKKALTEHAFALRTAAKSKDELLVDVIKNLPDLPSFRGDPVAIQRAMRDEWS